MRKLLLAPILAFAAAAQGPTVPPPIIRITCKPGPVASAKPYSDAKAAINVLGMYAATGLPQTWTIEMHDTFASIEDLDKVLDILPVQVQGDTAPTGDDLLAPPRTMIAVYQHDWSYHPEEAMRQLPKARYMRVTIHRIRLGLDGDFGELVRLRKVTNDSINLDRPELAYEVESGASSGTYLILSPLNTLRAMDQGLPDVPAFAAPVAEARAKAAPKAADIEIAREHLLFRLDPRLSYVSDDFASTDQPFWRGKPGGQ